MGSWATSNYCFVGGRFESAKFEPKTLWVQLHDKQSRALSLQVYGIRFGFRGFDPEEYEPMILTPQNVVNIHLRGGTILGTCRGYFNEDKILNFIKTNGVKMVFVIGGDGSHRAANKIHSLCKEQVLARTPLLNAPSWNGSLRSGRRAKVCVSLRISCYLSCLFPFEMGPSCSAVESTLVNATAFVTERALLRRPCSGTRDGQLLACSSCDAFWTEHASPCR